MEHGAQRAPGVSELEGYVDPSAPVAMPWTTADLLWALPTATPGYAYGLDAGRRLAVYLANFSPSAVDSVLLPMIDELGLGFFPHRIAPIAYALASWTYHHQAEGRSQLNMILAEPRGTGRVLWLGVRDLGRTPMPNPHDASSAYTLQKVVSNGGELRFSMLPEQGRCVSALVLLDGM